MLPALVISLDFELFWGVADSRTVDEYRRNIEGVHIAIPKMLALLRRYGVHATWATVGMLMCRDYFQWRQIRPSRFPGYLRRACSAYSLDETVRDNPKLFFARPLVEQILEVPGQELASHTYSHFYCGEAGATPEEFAADLACANMLASELGIRYRTLVFPRNQARKEFLGALKEAGIYGYRGNPDHWLYAEGHRTPLGKLGRALRFTDSWAPLTGHQVAQPHVESDGLVNVPASLFVRPWSRCLSQFEDLRMARLKRAMTMAARSGGICHLWWHPHNFGVNTERNLENLESVFKHFVTLQDEHGMASMTMREAADAVLTSRSELAAAVCP